MSAVVPVITVDGPSGAGKGTLCQKLATVLGWHLLDSGAIYRVLALATVYHHADTSSEQALAPLAYHLDVNFISENDKVKIILEGEDISNQIRTEKVGNIASQIATLPLVREALLERQRNFRESPGLVADGRDMGTVVFPDASLKIFLDASAEERAKRRMNQLHDKGFNDTFEDLLAEIRERDDRDRNRAVAPLQPAKDAIILDSTLLNIDEVIEQVLSRVQERGLRS